MKYFASLLICLSSLLTACSQSGFEATPIPQVGTTPANPDVPVTPTPNKNLIGAVTSGGSYQVAPSGQRLMVAIGQPTVSNPQYDSQGTLRMSGNLQGQLWIR